MIYIKFILQKELSETNKQFFLLIKKMLFHIWKFFFITISSSFLSLFVLQYFYSMLHNSFSLTLKVSESCYTTENGG